MLTGYFIFLLRMLVQRNLARTTQPARLVLPTEIANVCVLTDLLGMIVDTVGNTRKWASHGKLKLANSCWQT